MALSPYRPVFRIRMTAGARSSRLNFLPDLNSFTSREAWASSGRTSISQRGSIASAHCCRFAFLTILDRGDYGWVEYVEHRSCASDEEIRRYYRRTGNFLCLVYALNGSDFHFENMIADGEHPVPIDLETIYHHRAKIADGAR